MSDEHDPRWMGCSGNRMMHTPNLDRLAARGLRFTDAYTTCPICVPARAAFAVGKYIHQIGYWDNADPYDGKMPSWHHRLRDRGHRVVSVGKLHFRSTDDDNGFSESIVPMNVFERKGDLYGLLRGDDMPARADGKKLAGLAGPGESEYTWYDREIASRAQIWLREQAPKHRDKPWVLFVSFVAPHFPLTAPPHWYYKYPLDKIPMPKLYRDKNVHPYVRDQDENTGYDKHFEDEAAVKRARAGYFGLISSLDENIGNLLETLKDCGLVSEYQSALHLRPRRQHGRARPVGQAGALRGGRQGADDPRRPRRPGRRAPRAGEPRRRLSDGDAMRWAPRRRKLPGFLAQPEDSGTHRGLRVPRLLVERRRDHDPQRQVEVRLLRAVPGPAAAVRPGEAIRRSCAIWEPTRLLRRKEKLATKSCSRCSTRKRSTGAQSGDRPSSSPPTAAGRR